MELRRQNTAEQAEPMFPHNQCSEKAEQVFEIAPA
jgi:hypothetical protein